MNEETNIVDHPNELTHISLCAGYGGIDLGLRRALGAVRTVAFSEIESFATENLVAKVEAGHLDPAPIWTDLKTFPWGRFRGRVDILSGGFPCQPFSSSGRRAGDDDPRHLWPHITKGIRELERMGYEATAGVFSASEIGAPHQRKRVFILGCRADLSSEGRGIVDRLLRGTESANAAYPAPRGAEQYPWEPPRVTLENTVRRDKRSRGGFPRAVSAESADRETDQPTRADHDSGGRVQGQAEPAMGRDADGVASGMGYAELCYAVDNRTDELRLLGNGVVPATAEQAFRVLWADLRD